MHRIRAKLFHILFGAGRAAKTTELLILAAIAVSVTVVMLDSVRGADPAWARLLRQAEVTFTLIFSVEYVVRLLSHPRPLRYAFSLFGLVDLISIGPTWLEFAFPGLATLGALRVLRMVRIFRILSLGRVSRAAMMIGTALEATRYRMAAFLLGVGLISAVAGSLMYLFEGPGNGFSSIPASMYWAVLTLTTVGHEGVMPATTAGQLLTSVLVVGGYAVIAIPVGVITSEVMGAKSSRDALLAGAESERVEFKSSAFVSYRNPKTPARIIFEASVLKPVAGFLNARGGSLFIGVDDDGAPIGIRPDLELKRWNTDKYVRHLTERISGALGPAAAAITTISVERFGDQEVCILEVQPSPDPVWLRTSKGNAFYVRTSNSTHELRGPSLITYTRQRWY